MLRNRVLSGQRGDTLIEVTFALAILGFVLLGSTAIAATAFRTGQTARERTEVSVAAQEQMEALRSFRDNHSWAEFQSGKNCGSPGGYCGINQVLTAVCAADATAHCFHMESVSTAPGTTEWVPKSGSIAGTVPSSTIEISTKVTAASACGYDFVLYYQFTPLGGSIKARNQIATRLVNLKYSPGGIGASCL